LRPRKADGAPSSHDEAIFRQVKTVDRAIVADFRICTMFLGRPCEELNKRHDIRLTPTVLLLVKGKEVHRWVMDYDKQAYHRVWTRWLPRPPRSRAQSRR
jgi:hypothetical protein